LKETVGSQNIIPSQGIIKNRDKKPGMVEYAVIPALGRRTKEDHEFKVSLGNIARPCLKEKKTKQKEKEKQTTTTKKERI
jgi:hypothetical protein